MFVGIVTIPASYFTGNILDGNLLLSTMFFNMFIWGVVLNMLIDHIIFKINSALMMAIGGYFGYMEFHNPKEWMNINIINASLNVLISIGVCLLIERMKQLKKLKNEHRDS